MFACDNKNQKKKNENKEHDSNNEILLLEFNYFLKFLNRFRWR